VAAFSSTATYVNDPLPPGSWISTTATSSRPSPSRSPTAFVAGVVTAFAAEPGATGASARPFASATEVFSIWKDALAASGAATGVLQAASARASAMPILRTERSVRSATLTARRALPINRRRDHVADQRVAIYPGSFDPPTNGHLDIVDRGSRLFDRVVIGVGRNPSKKTVFTAEERVALMQEACGKLKNVEVRTFDSLQVEFARGA